MNRAAVGLAAVAFAGLAAMLAAGSPRMAALFLVGAACGVTLYHAAFSFAASYRRLLVHGDPSGVLPQLPMLALATVLFAPMLAAGQGFGVEAWGAVSPASVAAAIGAFLFGVGMQIGGGCGSGTLYTASGGNVRMMVVLLAFCIGGFAATFHVEAWRALPAPEPIALGEVLGWPAAVALQLGVLAACYLLLARRARGRAIAFPDPPAGWRRVLQGPWPMLAGALLLALLNAATLALAGHPWGITWAFTLWAAKVAVALGWNPDAVAYWREGWQRDALDAGLFEDVTSVMNVGLALGAMAAAGLAGRYAPSFRVPLRSLAAAILGGLLMGYGARLAYGCNIGAYFSGIASTSLHGWLWIAAALPGSWLGARLRPRFGLTN